MATRYFGQPTKRNEDPRLLTGLATFTDDVRLPDTLHVAFLRSPYAHARIRAVDAAAARGMPGVAAVYTAEDLGAYWQPGPLLVPPPPVPGIVFNARTQVPLARDKIRHAGEPVAVVVAASRYQAEDAVEAIGLDVEMLPAVVDLERALEPDAPLVHDDLERNLNAHLVQRKGDYERARQQADVVVARRLVYDRGTAAAMENRGIVAHWDARGQQLTVWDTTQAPIPIRNGLAAMLGLSEKQVRVIAPFIGGGFGPKIMMFYPEEVLVPWISMRLGRPVKWIEDRQENFYATTQERGQVHWAELALTREGKVLGVKDTFLHDAGAYAPYGLTVPLNSQCTLLGQYDVPNYLSEFSSVFTNKPIVTPYRGAGRQHGVFVMERLLDLAARELGIDRVEIRRRNLIPPDKFPYNNEVIYQDFAPLVYDSGNYLPALERAVEIIGYEKFVAEEQPRLRAEGRHVGIGVVTYVEGTGIGPYEGAKVTVEASGRVSVATGIGTQGQGHYTSFAQIVADQLGVDVTNVRLVTGDTAEFYWGAGTFASRGAVVAGNAIHAAAVAVRNKVLKKASDELEVDEEDLELVDGTVRIKGAPQTAIKLGELARQGEPPARGGQARHGTRPGGDGLLRPRTGRHGQRRPRDDRRGRPRDDDGGDQALRGRPRLRPGHQPDDPGGADPGRRRPGHRQRVLRAVGVRRERAVAQRLVHGLSSAYDGHGAAHRDGPRGDAVAAEPAGDQGGGEAGAIPVGPLFAQAIEDALHDVSLEILEIPLSPSRLFELVRATQE